MNIWRVEDEKGLGCYHLQPTSILLKRHANAETHPITKLDKEISRFPRKEEISGFATYLQAKKWFNDKELELLGRIGFVLKTVQVSCVTARSKYQLLAIR